MRTLPHRRFVPLAGEDGVSLGTGRRAPAKAAAASSRLKRDFELLGPPIGVSQARRERFLATRVPVFWKNWLRSVKIAEQHYNSHYM